MARQPANPFRQVRENPHVTPWFAWGLSLLALVATCAWSLGSGPFPTGLDDAVIAIWSQITHAPTSLDPAAQTVLWNIRLPRILAGMFIGMALAASGAVFQVIFRNPLVSPDILGVSSGAGLGASLGLFLGLPILFVQGMAFAFGLAAVATVCLIAASVRRGDPVLVLVLAGMAVAALLGAGISLIKVMADPYSQLSVITYWLLGSLNSVNAADARFAFVGIAVGLLPMVVLRWRINLLSLSDEEARSLGVNVGAMRWLLVGGATLATACAVSVSGIIGWVGLVVPHAARIIAGPRFERLLPASAILGAAFLVAADTLARTLTAIELPLGILTALVGAPAFIWLLWRASRERT